MSYKLFGYFDKPTDWENPGKPTYDPGLDVECLFCFKKLSAPMVTPSLMKMGDNKSYFYRVHKDCYENASPKEIQQYESTLIDNL